MKRVFVLFFTFGIFLVSALAQGRVGGGDIVFKVAKTKPVVFSHDFHVKDAGIACQKCHPGLYIAPEKDKRVTMTEMAKGKSCGACHNGKEASSVSAKDKCASCHR